MDLALAQGTKLLLSLCLTASQSKGEQSLQDTTAEEHSRNVIPVLARCYSFRMEVFESSSEPGIRYVTEVNPQPTLCFFGHVLTPTRSRPAAST